MLLYHFCKYLTLITSKFYYHKVIVSGLENMPKDKPVLLALNHPNSFLDAVLVGAYINRPTHFLARGDAFQNKYTNPILKSLNMLPVYRLSEGKENLSKNTETFDACQQILEENKIVIIFAEGLSENNYKLRSLKKGPARIALKAWNSESASKNLQILPIGLTYEHFEGGGKNIILNIGKPFGSEKFETNKNEALFVKDFNQIIQDNLLELAYINPHLEPGTEEHVHFRARFQKLVAEKKNGPQIINSLKAPWSHSKPANQNLIKQTFLFWPLYSFCNWLTLRIIKSSLFFDSIAFGLFLFLWPVYLLLIIILISFLIH